MAAFHEVRFPTDIEKGSSGGPKRTTEIVTLRSGYEERNSIWANSRRSYDAGMGLQNMSDIYEALEFFEARHGRLYGFRWKDWSDFKSKGPTETITALDVIIGTGNGTEDTFQLKKVYTSGAYTYTRDIKKPVEGTVLISVNGVTKIEDTDYAVDYTTGEIVFTVPPTNTHLVKAGFEFDVPVRFDQDEFEINVEIFSAGSVPSLKIIEIRV